MSILANTTDSVVVPVIGKIALPQAEYEAMCDYQGEFDVVCFQVITKTDQVSNYPLSPLLETIEQARKCLIEIQETVPIARISRQTFFYSSEDDGERKELLNSLVIAGDKSHG
ncbi:MAG: hypothetical protein GQ532_16395 [Methylomarinum sp.]|nr:hypothetical protein [Methylomarinum sp.]